MTCRVYKKSSPNNKLTLYLASRDIIVSEAKNDNKLLGVLLVDPDYVRDKKVRRRKMNYKYLFLRNAIFLAAVRMFIKKTQSSTECKFGTL